jgi:2-hydroxy-3-keto-5-methylthiopentenyl-1-phosphate phosphatase
MFHSLHNVKQVLFMKCALIYDFDGTLAEGDCTQHGLMPALGINNVASFWQSVKERARSDDGDEILSYLGFLLKKPMQLVLRS